MLLYIKFYWASLVAQMAKKSACNVGDYVGGNFFIFVYKVFFSSSHVWM